MQSSTISTASASTYADVSARHAVAKATTSPELSRLHALKTDLYFREHTEKGFIGDVTVTRVYVVDPSTGVGGSVVYLNDSDQVVLDVGSARFESVASQLPKWAEELGFPVQWHSAKVAV